MTGNTPEEKSVTALDRVNALTYKNLQKCPKNQLSTKQWKKGGIPGFLQQALSPDGSTNFPESNGSGHETERKAPEFSESSILMTWT